MRPSAERPTRKTDAPLALAPAADQQVKDVQTRVDAVASSALDFAAMDAQLDALSAELAAIVQAELDRYRVGSRTILSTPVSRASNIS